MKNMEKIIKETKKFVVLENEDGDLDVEVKPNLFHIRRDMEQEELEAEDERAREAFWEELPEFEFNELNWNAGSGEPEFTGVYRK